MAEGGDQYLFLYPIRPLFDSMMKACPSFMFGKYDVRRLGRIIDARYRDEGYGMNWLFFGMDGEESSIDISAQSEYFGIREGDRKLCANASFKRHKEEKAYADPGYVLDMLPTHDSLVLGGFHQDDCVERIAKESYGRGVKTWVDEDTTEQFFHRTILCGEIPLTGKSWTIDQLLAGHPDILEFARMERRKSPWLTQE